MGRKLFPSPNGFEFLEHYLTELYGERGSIKHNLIRYIESDYFKTGCRYVNNIEDLPEMTGELPLCKACFDNHYPV